MNLTIAVIYCLVFVYWEHFFKLTHAEQLAIYKDFLTGGDTITQMRVYLTERSGLAQSCFSDCCFGLFHDIVKIHQCIMYLKH